MNAAAAFSCHCRVSRTEKESRPSIGIITTFCLIDVILWSDTISCPSLSQVPIFIRSTFYSFFVFLFHSKLVSEQATRVSVMQNLRFVILLVMSVI